MSKAVVFLLAALLAVAAPVGSAPAALSVDEALERARTAPGELTMRDFSMLIESGELDGDRLAWALHQRGQRHYFNVRTTERALRRLGFEPGPVDGNLDAQAREAMRQWVAAGCP